MLCRLTGVHTGRALHVNIFFYLCTDLIKKRMENHQLDSMDEQILSMLIRNARTPFLEIARACGVSGTAIHQRVQRLTSLGIIQGTEYKIDPARIGYDTCAFVGLRINENADLRKIVDALRDVPEVAEVHCTGEEYDLLVKLYAHDNSHLFELIHAKLRPLGLTQTKVIVSLRMMVDKQLSLFPMKTPR